MPTIFSLQPFWSILAYWEFLVAEEPVQREFFMCHFTFPQHSKTVRLIGYHLIKAFIINARRGYGHLLTAAWECWQMFRHWLHLNERDGLFSLCWKSHRCQLMEQLSKIVFHYSSNCWFKKNKNKHKTACMMWLTRCCQENYKIYSWPGAISVEIMTYSKTFLAFAISLARSEQ